MKVSFVGGCSGNFFNTMSTAVMNICHACLPDSCIGIAVLDNTCSFRMQYICASHSQGH